MTLRSGLAAGLAVLVLAGCGSTADPGGPVPTTATPDPSAAARAQARLEQDRRARAAILGDKALVALSLRVDEPVGQGGDALSPCRSPLATDRDKAGGYLASWRNTTVLVRQYVASYSVSETAEVVSEVRASLTCGQHRGREGLLTLTGEKPLPAYESVDDRLAFCERIDSGPRTVCTALLAAADIVSLVRVTAPSESVAVDVLTRLADEAARTVV